jgi:putative copper export protein
MYQWIVFFHLIAAIIWVGGMLFLPLVLVPVVRREEPRLRAALMSTVGYRFRKVGWIAIGALLVTGVWNLHNRDIPWETILSTDLFSGTWGHILAAKLGLVAVLLLLSVFHDFVIGPRSTRPAQQRDTAAAAQRAERWRRQASWIGRVNALLAVAIIFFAVALVRGLPWQ